MNRKHILKTEKKTTFHILPPPPRKTDLFPEQVIFLMKKPITSGLDYRVSLFSSVLHVNVRRNTILFIQGYEWLIYKNNRQVIFYLRNFGIWKE